MIFYLSSEVKGSTGIIKKNVFLGGDFTIGNQKLNVNAIALVTDKDIRNLVSSVCDFKICKTNSFDVPIVTMEDYAIKAVPHADSTKLYNSLIGLCKKGFGLETSLDQALKDGNMEVFKQYIDKCKNLAHTQLESILKDRVDFFVECLLGFYRYSNFYSLAEFDSPAINQIDNDFIVETQEYINSFKKQITIGDNVTLRQSTYNSEFFIKIPTWYTLTSEELDDVSSLIPNLAKEVCQPYTESIAYTPSYKEAKNTPLNLIEGNAKNNGHHVFDYDERYYNSLISWCKNNMFQYYRDSVKSVDSIKDSAVIDPYSQEYLVELCKSLYSLHWAHNKNVPCSVSVDQNEDDESSSSSVSKYIFYGDAGEQSSFMNALILLEEFLKIASVECGYKVYPQAVLQLSRWGLDKPTALSFDNYSKIFLLGTNTVKDKEIPLDQCEIKQHGNCDYYLDRLIYLDKEITDKDLLTSGIGDSDESVKWLSTGFKTPIGIVLSADYIDKVSKKEIKNSVYYSFIDFVRRMVKDSDFAKNVYGLHLDGDSFVVDSVGVDLAEPTTVGELLISVNNNNSVYNPFYRSEDLVNVYISVNAKMEGEIPDSILKIMYDKIGSPSLSTDFEMIKFNSKEELIEKKKSFQILGSVQNAISVSVLREVLPVFAEANYRLLSEGAVDAGSINLEKVLQIYKTVMDSTFISEVKFYRSTQHVDDYRSDVNADLTKENAVGRGADLAKENAVGQGVADQEHAGAVDKMNLFSGGNDSSKDSSNDGSNNSSSDNSNTEDTVISQEQNQLSMEDLMFKKPGKGLKLTIKFVQFEEKKYIGVLFRCVAADNFTEFIFASIEDFDKMYPGYVNKIRTSEKFTSLVKVFLNQQTRLDQKINGKLFFLNKNAYDIFMKGIVSKLEQ